MTAQEKTTNERKPPVDGIPDLNLDKTFPHLVVGLARCSDPRTVERFLRGESVGRSDFERDALPARLAEATKKAIELRAREPLTREDVLAIVDLIPANAENARTLIAAMRTTHPKSVAITDLAKAMDELLDAADEQEAKKGGAS